MVKANYIKIFNDADVLLTNKTIIRDEFVLYISLLYECNYSNWKNPFDFSTEKLINKLQIGRSRFYELRNALKLKKIIDFNKGENQFSGTNYKLLRVPISNDYNSNNSFNLSHEHDVEETSLPYNAEHLCECLSQDTLDGDRLPPNNSTIIPLTAQGECGTKNVCEVSNYELNKNYMSLHDGTKNKGPGIKEGVLKTDSVKEGVLKMDTYINEGVLKTDTITNTSQFSDKNIVEGVLKTDSTPKNEKKADTISDGKEYTTLYIYKNKKREREGELRTLTLEFFINYFENKGYEKKYAEKFWYNYQTTGWKINGCEVTDKIALADKWLWNEQNIYKNLPKKLENETVSCEKMNLTELWQKFLFEIQKNVNGEFKYFESMKPLQIVDNKVIISVANNTSYQKINENINLRNMFNATFLKTFNLKYSFKFN